MATGCSAVGPKVGWCRQQRACHRPPPEEQTEEPESRDALPLRSTRAGHPCASTGHPSTRARTSRLPSAPCASPPGSFLSPSSSSSQTTPHPQNMPCLGTISFLSIIMAALRFVLCSYSSIFAYCFHMSSKRHQENEHQIRCWDITWPFQPRVLFHQSIKFHPRSP